VDEHTLLASPLLEQADVEEAVAHPEAHPELHFAALTVVPLHVTFCECVGSLAPIGMHEFSGTTK